MPSNFERWKAEYKARLLACIKAKPTDYWLKPGETPEEFADNVGEKVANSFLKSPYSVHVSKFMRAAAKACGAPGTSMKAIHTFITED